MKINKTFEKRFWSKVDKSGGNNSCWVWTGSKDSWGYGTIFSGYGKNLRAHRASWFMKNGEIPKGKIICHKCDNPPCVNVNHLFLGTDSINAKDRNAKGRTSRGERHSKFLPSHKMARIGSKNGRAILTPEQVVYIRENAKPYGVTRRFLAKKFGVGKTTIDYVLCGKSWVK
jgi:hypothetical protein